MKKLSFLMSIYSLKQEGCKLLFSSQIVAVLFCLFLGVLWLWHFLYSVGPHPVSSLHIYTFVVSRAFMAVAASQAGDADSSRAPGLTSGLQGSMNVHRGALLMVPQWQCISSFVFYTNRGCCSISDDLSCSSNVLSVPWWIFLLCIAFLQLMCQ